MATVPIPVVPTHSGISVEQVRVRNFRCLKAVDIELDDFTLLIGQNNSGKTSFLNAFAAAIGAGQRTLSEEDIFLGNQEVAGQNLKEIDALEGPMRLELQS